MHEASDKPELWGVLELMGHVRLAGRITEEERFGTKLGRIDIPKRDKCICPHMEACTACGGTGYIETFVTQYFSGSSIYRLTPTSEETARKVAASCQPTPVHPWEMPRQLTAPAYGDED